MHGEEEKAEAAILAAFVHWPCATARAWTNSYLHHFIDAAMVAMVAMVAQVAMASGGCPEQECKLRSL